MRRRPPPPPSSSDTEGEDSHRHKKLKKYITRQRDQRKGVYLNDLTARLQYADQERKDAILARHKHLEKQKLLLDNINEQKKYGNEELI
jgi:CRISPR/Cas system-associated protein Cas10 (large subunit of type III CRISPR-Cas system)